MNAEGHCLTVDEINPGDIAYRDVSDDGNVQLRVGCNIVISAGYAQMNSGNQSPDEIIAEVVENLKKALQDVPDISKA